MALCDVLAWMGDLRFPPNRSGGLRRLPKEYQNRVTGAMMHFRPRYYPKATVYRGVEMGSPA